MVRASPKPRLTRSQADYASDIEDGVDAPVYGHGADAQGMDQDADGPSEPAAARSLMLADAALDQQRLVEAAQLAAENAQALEQVPDQVKKVCACGPRRCERAPFARFATP